MHRFIFIIFILLIFSCTKQQKIYTPAELKTTVDSILQIKIPVLQLQAAEDFKNRLPIELKFKVDSILNVSYETPDAPELENSSSVIARDALDSLSTD